jgi:hypothetical protein
MLKEESTLCSLVWSGGRNRRTVRLCLAGLWHVYPDNGFDKMASVWMRKRYAQVTL